MRSGLPVAVIALGLLSQGSPSTAEDERIQYPRFLANSYFDVGIGYIDYPFSSRQLEEGFRAESVHVPHAAARLVLLGYRFNEHVAAQLSYMRPVQWVTYKSVNGVPADRSVWMNLMGLTFRGTVPLTGRLLLDGEGGVGLVTRHGFQTHDIPPVTIIKDANYWAALLGGGFRYRLNRSWDLGVNATYSPSNEAVRQPHTLLIAGGFTYNIQPLSEEHVKENSGSGFAFPRSLAQVGYSTDAAGFEFNHIVSGVVPIFWGGLAQVKHGVAVRYQRNVFHTRKVFSFDIGASVSYWKSRAERATFYTASLFPEFRFTPFRMRGADLYFNYSLLGPTSISRVSIDGNDTGRHFTFQDFMGMGVYAGKDRHFNAEIHIGHYSNGNVFPQNAGVSIPLTFDLGYAFH